MGIEKQRLHYSSNRAVMVSFVFVFELKDDAYITLDLKTVLIRAPISREPTVNQYQDC